MMQKKKGILIGGIILIIIATVVTCFVITRDNPLESHLKLAVKYFNDGDYEEAILEFNKAIAINDKIPQIYSAKANAEIALGKEDEALESTIKMIELLKVDDEYIARESLILLEMFNSSKYPEYDDLLLWFYETSYGDEKYKEYCTWIEDYLDDSFEDALKMAREDYEKSIQDGYTDIYRSILTSYLNAEESNYEYDYVSGESFEEKYPNINPEIPAAGGNTELTYSIIDINEDAVPELFIRDGRSGAIYDMYGIKNGKPERLFDVYSMGYRMIYTIYEDGIIGYQGSGSANSGSYEFFKVNPSGSEKMVASIESVSWDDLSGPVRYFLTRAGGDTNTEITEEERNDIVNKYKADTNISWTYLKYSEFAE